MSIVNDYLFSLTEAHVRLTCDGLTLHSDGLPDGPDSLPLPKTLCSGLCQIYFLLERMLPSLSCISVSGIWDTQGAVPFRAFDIWLQTEEGGFYLPMASATCLFSDNGIPYYHKHPEE